MYDKSRRSKSMSLLVAFLVTKFVGITPQGIEKNIIVV